jgi:hypothetical protein
VALRGRTRLCRGCLLATGGAIVGTAVGLLVPALGAWSLGLAFVSTIGALAPARLGKLWTRLLPAVALAAAFGAGLRGPLALGLALSGVSAGCGLGLLWAYGRRGPNREPCESCPEYRLAVPCSGVQPILRREAAFRRLTSRWLDAATPLGPSDVEDRPSTSLGANGATSPAPRAVAAAPAAP